jgi:predicted ATP-grasp superfamily ATP-dependent carboligase
LGNFLVRTVFDESIMREQLAQHWPDAKLVANSIIENVVSDVGVQFFLRRDGGAVWLGLTEQQFNEKRRWSGGVYSAAQQQQLRDGLADFIGPTATHLHAEGYFGLVGIDVLTDADGDRFLVDVNPRLTGVSPFLMASRQFQNEGAGEGVYLASQRFGGNLDQLMSAAEAVADARVLILSAYEDAGGQTTICHLSISSDSQETNRAILDELLA